MNRTKKFLISGFILFNLLTMIRVHMPLQNEIVASLYKPIDSYLSFFSLYQSWRMFSPNPARTNVHLTAEVEFDDGSTDVYYYPDAAKMTLAEKYTSGERFRVITEAIRRDANRHLWADASKFALRKLKDNNFQKVPMKVHLYRHWNIIPEMDKQFIPHLTKTKSYNKYKFYTHEVL